MASLKKFVGRISPRRAQLALRPRRGRGLKATRLGGKKPVDIEYVEAVQEEQQQLEARLPTESRKYYNSVEAQVMATERLKQIGMKLHATELAGTLLLADGLEGEHLRKMFAALDAIGVRATKQGQKDKYYAGSFRMFISSAKQNLFERVNSVLERRKEETITTDQIAEELFPGFRRFKQPQRRSALSLVSTALGSLEYAGLASKQYRTHGKNPLFAWTHYEHRLSTPLPKKHVGYRILRALKDGPKSRMQLSAELGIPDVHIRHWSNYLQPTQAVKEFKVKEKGRSARRELRLTTAGKSVVNKQGIKKTLTPKTRAILLGEPIAQKPHDLKMIDKITQWLRVLQERERTGLGSRALAARIDLERGYVEGIIYSGAEPWPNKIGAERLRFFLDEITAADSELGKTFAKYCREKRLFSNKRTAKSGVKTRWSRKKTP